MISVIISTSIFLSDCSRVLGPTIALAVILLMTATVLPQQPSVPAPQAAIKHYSTEFIQPDGLSVDRLIELGTGRRADLLAARQRLSIAQGKLIQAGLRPNPTLNTEYGSPRFLGGEAESDLKVGVSQLFELGGKRSRRVAVAELEINKAQADVAAIERAVSIEIRTAYTSALSAARQLDVLEKLIAANEELLRVTEARLKEGDVAPLDTNLVRVENDRFKVQSIQVRNQVDTAVLELKTLIGADINEALKLAPQPDRPPRFDMGLTELSELALRTRPDLNAARINEEIGAARINLAKANGTPNIEAGVAYSRSNSIIDFPPRIGGGSFPNKDNSLVFSVSVGIPVFNRNQGEIASATGEKIQATRDREFLESTVKRDVAVAYKKYRAAAESLVIYSTQIVPRSEENLRTVRASYGLGDFSVFEVVNEQRRLTENITNFNQVLKDYYNALTELETAIGAPLPSSGFSPGSTSVLPDKDDAPSQVDRAKLLDSIRSMDGQTTTSSLKQKIKDKN